MITYSSESFTEHLEELKTLLPLHYEELALDKDKVPLAPIYEFYIAKEALGELVFYVARKDSQLIGYFIGFVSPGLHYKTCLTCIMDIFYLHPDHRGTRIGTKLLLFAEKHFSRPIYYRSNTLFLIKLRPLSSQVI